MENFLLSLRSRRLPSCSENNGLTTRIDFAQICADRLRAAEIIEAQEAKIVQLQEEDVLATKLR